MSLQKFKGRNDKSLTMPGKKGNSVLIGPVPGAMYALVVDGEERYVFTDERGRQYCMLPMEKPCEHVNLEIKDALRPRHMQIEDIPRLRQIEDIAGLGGRYNTSRRHRRVSAALSKLM